MAAKKPVRLLASVTSEAEARLAVTLGADFIDAKNPAEGALGALPHATVRAIVKSVGGRRPVSATIGDMPSDPETVAAAVRAMAATGVDYVKVGVFPGGDARVMIARLGDIDLGTRRLVAVLLADRAPDLSLIADLGAAGFSGVMLDTADKASGALTDVAPGAVLAKFIADARRAGLFAGLAGALRFHHLAPLLELEPDILGFRGALCEGAQRSGALDAKAIARIRVTIPFAITEARAS